MSLSWPPVCTRYDTYPPSVILPFLLNFQRSGSLNNKVWFLVQEQRNIDGFFHSTRFIHSDDKQQSVCTCVELCVCVLCVVICVCVYVYVWLCGYVCVYIYIKKTIQDVFECVTIFVALQYYL